MNGQTTATPRYRSFTYHTAVAWKDGRQGTLGSQGKPSFAVASPPEFRGIPGVWTPEDLFLAAVESCQMTTFLALADRAGIQLRGYESTASGTLANSGDGYRFTAVEVRPRICVAPGTDTSAVEHLVHQAHRNCLVVRSVSCPVEVLPEIVTQG
jgi:organic hydroperoxide reductase OsmC/OhrA